MDYRGFIWKTFLETVRNSKCPGELKDQILYTKNQMPRVRIFFDNMYQEIMRANFVITKRRGHPLKPKTVKETVEGLTEMFLIGCVEAAMKEYMSENEKKRLEAEQTKKSDIEQTLQGNSQGVFEEMGVVVDEKISDERDVEISQT